jgi:hypothetical protein
MKHHTSGSEFVLRAFSILHNFSVLCNDQNIKAKFLTLKQGLDVKAICNLEN